MAYNAKGRMKNFPVFDCDSHIYEPPEVWDKFIPENQRDFAKTHFYRDAVSYPLKIPRSVFVTRTNGNIRARPGIPG